MDGSSRSQPIPQPLGPELDRIIENGLVVPVYQPIVDLASGRTVAFESLARGPRGSQLERPDQLFATARATGRLHALDWACRTAAVRGALEGRLGPPFALFVNAEPDVLESRMPSDFAAPWATARLVYLRLMFEITERAMTERPAELLKDVERLRSWGWGIALDDVGADPRSLAMLPFLNPDVIKLDMRVIHEPDDPEVAEIVTAVSAEVERSGATLLAEGIETEEHLETAVAFGAHLGQGWFFGRPAPLPEALPAPGPAVRFTPGSESAGSSETPFEFLSSRLPTRVASARRLLSLTRVVERRAEAVPHPPVLISAFQSGDHFRPAAPRYARLVARMPLVAALGVGVSSGSAPGVRLVDLDPEDRLSDEWIVASVSPYSGMMLAAREITADRSPSEARFDLVFTADRNLVVEAVSGLIGRISGDADEHSIEREGEVSFAAAVAAAVAEARETEDLARPVLRLMAAMTGLESTFLSQVTETDYDILVSENSGGLDVPEGFSMPWPQAICKQALDMGRQTFDDVQAELPGNREAVSLNFRTFVTCPVVIEGGKVVGTLCGASSNPGGLSPDHLEAIRSFAALLARHVAPDEAAGLGDPRTHV